MKFYFNIYFIKIELFLNYRIYYDYFLFIIRIFYFHHIKIFSLIVCVLQIIHLKFFYGIDCDICRCPTDHSLALCGFSAVLNRFFDCNFLISIV